MRPEQGCETTASVTLIVWPFRQGVRGLLQKQPYRKFVTHIVQQLHRGGGFLTKNIVQILQCKYVPIEKLEVNMRYSRLIVAVGLLSGTAIIAPATVFAASSPLLVTATAVLQIVVSLEDALVAAAGDAAAIQRIIDGELAAGNADGLAIALSKAASTIAVTDITNAASLVAQAVTVAASASVATQQAVGGVASAVATTAAESGDAGAAAAVATVTAAVNNAGGSAAAAYQASGGSSGSNVNNSTAVVIVQATPTPPRAPTQVASAGPPPPEAAGPPAPPPPPPPPAPPPPPPVEPNPSQSGSPT